MEVSLTTGEIQKKIEHRMKTMQSIRNVELQISTQKPQYCQRRQDIDKAIMTRSEKHPTADQVQHSKPKKSSTTWLHMTIKLFDRFAQAKEVKQNQGSAMVTSTSTPGSIVMDVICFTTSGELTRSITRLCTRSSKRSQVFVPLSAQCTPSVQ